jgi:formylglycine-generating enzyme required for sulfatase activity
LPIGGGKAATHPVQEVNWFDVIKWCNARSEKEGMVPCYTVGGSPLRTGTVIPVVNWTVRGYRLPTEAEWEKAARGGLNGKRFPWGDTISHSQANYQSNNAVAYDISPTRGFHPDYGVSNLPYTSPVESFAANGYGLKDMSGNVFEWCWDWYETYASGAQTNPKGSASGSFRVLRGGSWYFSTPNCRVASRDSYIPLDWASFIGFRVALFADASARTAPIVTTVAAVPGVGEGTFTVSGSVTNDGGTPVTSRGIVYGLTATPTLGTAMDAPASGAGTGAFSSTLTGLAPDTTYYARAYASSTVGTSYGADVTFKTAPATPAGFSLIPAGVFQMGDSFGEGDVAERPLRQVTVSAFYMAQQETTKALWDEVRAWGVSRGYTDLPVGNGKAANHPVHTVSWFDIIKWCNARSEKEGLTPCYTVGGSPQRTGTATPLINWTAKGYRLPTEAEWEKAARGGLNGKKFPWGDTIVHSQANYVSDSAYAYDISPTRGHHPNYAVGDQPYTSPVGSFAANGYGLYDMSGNLFEWCWDWYGTYASGIQTDPKGSASGSSRVARGGSWNGDASNCRGAFRGARIPSDGYSGLGFRVALFADASARTAPIVATGAAVAGDGAGTFTVSGSVTFDGGSPVTARGVVYGLVPEPTLTSSMVSPAGAGTGDFSSPLTNLVLDTTYYARAYATNALGTRYGAEITFKRVDTPTGFSLISAGVFQMGDALDGIGDAPVRQVTVSAFYMAQRETTKALWDEVRAWGASRGYTDLPIGGGKAATHPVQEVNWFDVIKWCNARSEKEGLTPCFTVGGSPLRTGTAIPVVNWTAKGYRLPTEAEWEKAARGGLNGKRFPLGDTLTHSQANYVSDSAYAYDISPTRGSHPTYAVGNIPYTSPVGSFTPNGYGLYDMSGNVYEWCWDWYGNYVTGSLSDPRGASSGADRVFRGGSWGDVAFYCRVAGRNIYYPSYTDARFGFRVARGL